MPHLWLPRLEDLIVECHHYFMGLICILMRPDFIEGWFFFNTFETSNVSVSLEKKGKKRQMFVFRINETHIQSEDVVLNHQSSWAISASVKCKLRAGGRRVTLQTLTFCWNWTPSTSWQKRNGGSTVLKIPTTERNKRSQYRHDVCVGPPMCLADEYQRWFRTGVLRMQKLKTPSQPPDRSLVYQRFPLFKPAVGI